MSDAVVKDVIAAAASGNEPLVASLLRAAREKGASAVLIRRLRFHEEDVPEAGILLLTSTIARNAADLPRADGALGLDWSFSQAGILVAHLLKRLPDNEDRVRHLQQIVGESASVRFAVECLKWSRRSETDNARGFLEEPDQKRVAGTLIERVKREIGNGSPFRQYGYDTAYILSVWTTLGDVSELQNLIRQLVEREGVDTAEEIIKGYCARAWGADGPSVADFDGNGYNSLKNIIDPDFLYDVLRSHYGSELDEPEYHHDRGIALGRRLAHQFAFVHRQVIRKAASGGATTPPKEE